MKAILKRILKVMLAIIIVLILFFVIYCSFQLVTRYGYGDDVRAMCQVRPGDDIDKVYAMALERGFSNIKDYALPYEISLRGKKVAIRFSEQLFLESNAGTITFGRVIFPPFLRHYCHITYDRREVVNTRISILD